MELLKILFLTCLVLIGCNQTKQKEKTDVDNNQTSFTILNPKIYGYVPNAETAIRIAKAIWIPLYGETDYLIKPLAIWTSLYGETDYLNKTFRTELSKDGVWKVYNKIPEDAEGVELYAYINKMDGKIIKVYGIRKYKSEL